MQIRRVSLDCSEFLFHLLGSIKVDPFLPEEICLAAQPPNSRHNGIHLKMLLKQTNEVKAIVRNNQGSAVCTFSLAPSSFEQDIAEREACNISRNQSGVALHPLAVIQSLSSERQQLVLPGRVVQFRGSLLQCRHFLPQAVNSRAQLGVQRFSGGAGLR